MRLLPVVALLVAGTAAAIPRIAPQEAVRHRGERVTLSGPVSAIENRPDGSVLMVGTDFPVPVRVPEATRTRLGQGLRDLRGHEVELTGTVTPAGQPLELVLDRPEQLADAIGGSPDDVRTLRERVRALEDELVRLKAAQPQPLKGMVYGPKLPADRVDIPRYATEAAVLAERGVPSRSGWGPKGRVLYYGRERWAFDQNGQLLSVDRDR